MLKHLSEYQNKEVCQVLLRRIHAAVREPIRLMEVCGTHTMSIARNGIRGLMPQPLTLLSGPGCPVCVTSQGEIDRFIRLAKYKEVIIATFGDLMRVPASESSLNQQRAEGADIRIVYSALDALEMARSHLNREIVLLGVGFETTAPTIAAAVLEAEKEGIGNFSVISAHKLIPSALKALMENNATRIHGFICPGHVSVIIGAKAFVPLAETYRVPCVVAGFEPADILHAIYMLARQIENQSATVEIAYRRGVTFEGNANARQVMGRVFETCDAHWRGLGCIAESGLKFRAEYGRFDGEKKFDLPLVPASEPRGCSCGDILMGIKSPPQCALYARTCTPSDPVGPCMVSMEGTCAAYYKYAALIVFRKMNTDKILLDHGSGGRASHELVREIFYPHFENTILAQMDDSAVVTIARERLAFSTDSYVVDPIFFPGGSIGDLALNGTVNDLAMCGAQPLFISAGFIIEEGFPIEDLQKILQDMQQAAQEADVQIVTGDTKVVHRKAADKIFINTSGIGKIPDGVNISGKNAAPGDHIILSGTVGDHGITILMQREGLCLDLPVRSDSAPLNHMVKRIIKSSRHVHTLRDPTRGGVAASLNEIAAQAGVGIKLYESAVPIRNETKGACELLGLDPLYIANEGKLIACVVEADAEAVLAAIRTSPYGQDAQIMGEVTAAHPGKVVMETAIGGTRIVDMPTGEQLPRIC